MRWCFTQPNYEKIVINPSSFSPSNHPWINLLNYFTDIVLSEDIIIEAIHELSPSSAAGPNGILSSLLVNCVTGLAPLLFKIFTHSLTSGVVPPSFKRVTITPVFKSSDRRILGNYHSISLTPVLSKVLERIQFQF